MTETMLMFTQYRYGNGNLVKRMKKLGIEHRALGPKAIAQPLHLFFFLNESLSKKKTTMVLYHSPVFHIFTFIIGITWMITMDNRANQSDKLISHVKLNSYIKVIFKYLSGHLHSNCTVILRMMKPNR